MVQPAFSGGGTLKLPGGIGMALRAGIALWNQLGEQVKKGKTPIIVARARVYAPSGEDELVLELVGEIDRDEADDYCKRYPEVRNQLSEIAKLARMGFKGSERAFGSLVHHRMAKYVNDQRNDDFRAEVTNSLDEDDDRTTRRHYKGSTFLDVYERTSQDTVCVYDHKTGRAGISGVRAIKLANTAFNIHPTAKRILIIEVRPGL